MNLGKLFAGVAVVGVVAALALTAVRAEETAFGEESVSPLVLTHGDLSWNPRMVGRTLRVRRNRYKTRFSLKYDCGAAGVRSLPRKSAKWLISLAYIAVK